MKPLTHGCIFGDSLARGVIYDDASAKYLIAQNGVVELVAAKLSLCIDNFARFGATIQKGAKMLSKRLESPFEYEFVALEFGGNDCDFDWAAISENPDVEHLPKTSLKAFCEQYREIIRNVKAKGAVPLVINLPPIDEERYFAKISQNLNADNILRWLGGSPRYIYNYHESYNIGVSEVANAENARLIDLRSEFLRKRNMRDLLCSDGIHLNPAGHAFAAEIIEAATQRV